VSQKEKEKKKALIIGVSDYTHLPALKFCVNDGNRMVNVLDQKISGYKITKPIGLEIRSWLPVIIL
jgi:hypothetical protein